GPRSIATRPPDARTVPVLAPGLSPVQAARKPLAPGALPAPAAVPPRDPGRRSRPRHGPYMGLLPWPAVCSRRLAARVRPGSTVTRSDGGPGSAGGSVTVVGRAARLRRGAYLAPAPGGPGGRGGPARRSPGCSPDPG